MVFIIETDLGQKIAATFLLATSDDLVHTKHVEGKWLNLLSSPRLDYIQIAPGATPINIFFTLGKAYECCLPSSVKRKLELCLLLVLPELVKVWSE